jgi:uncharacterized protein (TIGR03089 family)
MFLSAPSPDASIETLADAVKQATAYGHRPAVTAIGPHGRYEQSYVSLAQWAAKGAHLLTADLLLEPGDRLAICSRVSWHTSAILLAAWWVGLEVSLDPHGAAVVILSEKPDVRDPNAQLFSVGDTIDGAPHEPFGVPAWTHEVRMFPDTPPPATCTAEMIALSDHHRRLSHRDVLARHDNDRVIGCDVSDTVTLDTLCDIAARPMARGQRTIILDGVPRTAADAERVDVWR